MVIKRGGGRGRGRGGVRKGAEPRSRDDNRSQQQPRDSYGEPVEKLQRNPALEAYYIDHDIIPMEEWATFMDHLRAPLPTSFRITSGKATTPVLLEQMRNYYLPFLSNVEYEGEMVPPPQSLPWYPEGLGWQINVKKNALRKTEEFRQFQHFLVHETEVGNISRQESVSMIPPLFLDVQPHHIVLDMCAAPGSKTAQLIEAIHSPVTAAPDTYDPCPLGIVVANDSDAKRAHMLIHQSQRLPSPNLVVANYDATHWPTIKVPYKATGTAAGSVEQKVMQYDRILTDVPCSGDGTIRKNLMVWKDWHPFNGAALHLTQLRILQRGLANLRNGGRLVYSTCSMNPLENEAVVAAALRESGGTVRLLDQTGVLPDLKRRPGLTTWKVLATKGKNNLNRKVPGREGEWADSKSTEIGADYREKLPPLPYTARWEDLDDVMKEKVAPSLWPAGDEEANHLDRCMRIYPHDQNTGGFFVAVLEKQVEGAEMIERGMAEGMVRAMDHLDAMDDAARAQSRKRLLSSPSGEEEEEVQRQPSKKLKDEEGAAKETVATATAAAASEGEVLAGEAKSNGANEPEAAAGPSNAAAAVENGDSHAHTVLAGGTPFREDPMAYVDVDDEQSKSLVSFFNLDKTFSPRNLLVRNKEARPMRSVYLTSTSVRALISSGGPGRGGHPYGNPLKLRLLNCGIRAFQKQDSGKDARLQCKWRVMSDGIPALRPFVDVEHGGNKVVKATLDDLAFLMRNHYPKTQDVPEGPFHDQIASLEMGSHFCDVQAGTITLQDHHDEQQGQQSSVTLHRQICVPIWRAAASLNLMLDRQEKSALSFRIFGSDLSNATGERQFANGNGKQKQKANLTAAAATEEQGTVEESLDEDALQELENAAAKATASE